MQRMAMGNAGLALGLTALAAVMSCSSSRDQAVKKMIADRKSRDTAPRVGEDAPNFSLSTKGGERTVELASFRGKKPVVLIFGSYT